MWRWAEGILAPASTQELVAAKWPIGNNSDLYPRWLGAREVLRHGRDPYGADVTREIQTGFYGRPLSAGNPADPTAREAFVYPLYVVFLLAPTVGWSFASVAAVFRWLLLAAIAGSVPLWMYALNVRLRRPSMWAAMFLALASYPAVEEYFQQNLSALVIFFLAAAAATAARDRLVLSGFLLALATMKPDVTAIAVLWFILWTTGNWKLRSRLFWSFAITMATLSIAGEIISPGWVWRFAAAVREYPSYGADPSIFHVLLPAPVAGSIETILIIMLVAFCWQRRRASAGSENFAWAMAWVAAVTLAILPKLAPYNQLLLIPAMLVLVRRYKELPRAGLISRAITKAAFACQFWQWLAATALSFCALFLPASRLPALAEAPMYTLLALVPLTLGAVILSSRRVQREVIE
jgi:Glycosyltransferase family 87